MLKAFNRTPHLLEVVVITKNGPKIGYLDRSTAKQAKIGQNITIQKASTGYLRDGATYGSDTVFQTYFDHSEQVPNVSLVLKAVLGTLHHSEVGQLT